MKKTSESTIAFKKNLTVYKTKIDKDVQEYCKTLLNETYEGFGEYPVQAVQAYSEILSRGGKRIRGALVIVAYKMLGGTDESVARRAALAVEMLHAHVLMIDDIQDRSRTRRSGPTAHITLKNYHESNHLKGNSQHFGESIALNGSLIGLHSALNVLADLDISDKRKLSAIKNINKHFIITAHGQSMDIFNESLQANEESDIDRVLLWKTVFYSFLNPLQLGAILAGGSNEDLKIFENYSLHAGRVFQITDDILGIFGEEQSMGKSPLDDIAEGKRTLLIIKALEQASEADRYFLESMLGNTELTQAEFEHCKVIIEKSGALGYAQKQAKDSMIDALASLQPLKKKWGDDKVVFLEQLVQSFIDRKY